MSGVEKKLDQLTTLVRALGTEARERPARKRVGVPKTQEEFERLPGLISREEFLDWTGLCRDYVDEEVKAKRIRVLVLREDGHRKYYKSEVARLANFRM